VRTQVKKRRYAEKLRDNVQLSIEAAITDALTGLHNRRYMESHLGTLVEQAASASQAIVEQAQALTAMIAHYQVAGEEQGAVPLERRASGRPWVAGAGKSRSAGQPAAGAKPGAVRKAATAAGGDAEWQEF